VKESGVCVCERERGGMHALDPSLELLDQCRAGKHGVAALPAVVRLSKVLQHGHTAARVSVLVAVVVVVVVVVMVVVVAVVAVCVYACACVCVWVLACVCVCARACAWMSNAGTGPLSHPPPTPSGPALNTPAGSTSRIGTVRLRVCVSVCVRVRVRVCV